MTSKGHKTNGKIQTEVGKHKKYCRRQKIQENVIKRVFWLTQTQHLTFRMPAASSSSPHSLGCLHCALRTVRCFRCDYSFCFTACPSLFATSFRRILKALEQKVCVVVDSTAVTIVANRVARWVAGVGLKEPGPTTRTYPAGCVIGVVWRV